MSQWWIDGAPFTCENARFKTDLAKAQPHGPGQAAGSVFPTPLVGGRYSLWLEHAIDKNDGADCFWLMWYDPDGVPITPESGAIWPDDFRAMVVKLSSFLEAK